MNLEKLTCPVHSIETFGAVDGPGIRFVIFTQGCNLQCKYCQNRDTWSHKGGTPYTVNNSFWRWSYNKWWRAFNSYAIFNKFV